MRKKKAGIVFDWQNGFYPIFVLRRVQSCCATGFFGWMTSFSTLILYIAKLSWYSIKLFFNCGFVVCNSCVGPVRQFKKLRFDFASLLASMFHLFQLERINGDTCLDWKRLIVFFSFFEWKNRELLFVLFGLIWKHRWGIWWEAGSWSCLVVTR